MLNRCIFFLLLIFSIFGENASAVDEKKMELFAAVESEDVDALISAIQEGVDIDIRNNEGLTPLMLAAKNGSEAVVSALIDKKAEINTYNEDSRMTALHYAAEEGHLSVTKLLVEKGADTTIESSNRKTAYDLAKRKKHREVVDYLKGYRARLKKEKRKSEEVADESEVYRLLSETVLSDANAVRLALAQIPDLVEALGNVKKTGRSESNAWSSKRSTTYKQVALSLQRQIKAEAGLIKVYAEKETADEVVSTTDAFVKRWGLRFALINDEISRLRREERRKERRGQGQDEKRGRRGNNEGPPVGHVEPETEINKPEYDISDWLATNMSGSLNLCTTVHEELMKDYGSLLFSAKKANATNTLLSIEAVIIERGQRYNEILERVERNEERENRRNERSIRSERNERSRDPGHRENDQRLRR